MMGVELDVGEFPPVTSGADENDPARPVRILAHILARLADRFAPLRKFSRGLEGSDKAAGIGSDLIAEAVELYSRNPDQVELLARNYLSGLEARRAARATATNGATKGSRFRRKPPPQGTEVPYEAG